MKAAEAPSVLPPPELVLVPCEPVGGRTDADHFPTPSWVSELLVQHGLRQRWWEAGDEVLDPCCGEGALLDVLAQAGLKTHGLELDPGRAGEARRRGHQASQRDSLDPEAWWPRVPVIITNPPFVLAEPFVRRALSVLPARGRLCMLLRQSWQEPVGTRGALLRETLPDVLFLPKRPRYDLRGSDSVTSAWFCWPGQGRYGYL